MPVDQFPNHTLGCPDGEWVGRLDGKSWGKSQNLVLYFTKTGSGDCFRFSVFFDKNYAARDGGVNFSKEEPGALYRLTTSITSPGKPAFLTAVRTT